MGWIIHEGDDRGIRDHQAHHAFEEYDGSAKIYVAWKEFMEDSFTSSA